MTTFATILSRLLRADPGRPLVTFYDHASGERTELSVATYANWVAKTASLLVEEHDLERGQVARIDLPTHWLGPVWLGAAWTVGLRVVLDDEGPEPDLVLTGPEGLPRWAPLAGDAVVIASALHPLGLRFTDPLPVGVHDFGADVWSQPDAFVPYDPPGPDDAALGDLTQQQVWETAAGGSLLTDGGRLLSSANPASPSGFPCLTEPLVRDGSVVLVAHPDPDRVGATYDAERATARA
ncbi:TIGR03089 family protein [Nocardioides euryhalodurans]|uniref:TIGR03089 family protein n=1 Tax=Nocardioides euryhalodurans TaxID=2518370 RepID=A0A4P7GIZ5_9ACTN|nr:TIGR03089 family protein [Nocardioides euryhalodurans]QBR91978.1 TIGR03089 family protein [Nocardioides euryhalodurans]